MALIKQKTLPSGHTVEYWRVLEVNTNFDKSSAHVVIGGYKNQTARNAGDIPVDFISYDFDSTNFPFTVAELDKDKVNAVKITYLEAKKSKLDENGVETNFLANAVDVI